MSRGYNDNTTLYQNVRQFCTDCYFWLALLQNINTIDNMTTDSMREQYSAPKIETYEQGMYQF